MKGTFRLFVCAGLVTLFSMCGLASGQLTQSGSNQKRTQPTDARLSGLAASGGSQLAQTRPRRQLSKSEFTRIISTEPTESLRKLRTYGYLTQLTWMDEVLRSLGRHVDQTTDPCGLYLEVKEARIIWTGTEDFDRQVRAILGYYETKLAYRCLEHQIHAHHEETKRTETWFEQLRAALAQERWSKAHVLLEKPPEVGANAPEPSGSRRDSDALSRHVKTAEQLAATLKDTEAGQDKKTAETLGKLNPEDLPQEWRRVAHGVRAYIELLNALGQPQENRPDLSRLQQLLDDLRSRVRDDALMARLQQEFAVIAFLDGHPTEARTLLPQNGPEDSAKALLRDMQVMLQTDGGELTTPVARRAVGLTPGKSVVSARGPPFLIPDIDMNIKVTFTSTSPLAYLPPLDEVARRMDWPSKESVKSMISGLSRLAQERVDDLQNANRKASEAEFKAMQEEMAKVEKTLQKVNIEREHERLRTLAEKEIPKEIIKRRLKDIEIERLRRTERLIKERETEQIWQEIDAGNVTRKDIDVLKKGNRLTIQDSLWVEFVLKNEDLRTITVLIKKGELEHIQQRVGELRKSGLNPTDINRLFPKGKMSPALEGALRKGGISPKVYKPGIPGK